MTAAFPPVPRRFWPYAVALAAFAAAPAHAQFMSTNSAEFNSGWGRVAGTENQATNISTKDANGNRVIVDGLILTGDDNSNFNSTSGAGDAAAGASAFGSGGATAIGNNLIVVTQGNYNTVIVTSTQTNNGTVTATTNAGGTTTTSTATSGGVGNGP